MKYHKPLILLAAVLLIGFGTTVTAATEDEAKAKVKAKAIESAVKAEEAKLQAQLKMEHKHALAQVEKDRLAAERTMEKAREHLHRASGQKREASEESALAHAAAMEEMQEELDHARRQLRVTSREIARVNREVVRARAKEEMSRHEIRTLDRPVIGVILGDANDIGIKILGVSPDGPSERAGIKQGDVIVALGGRVLAAIEEDGNVRSGLKIAMHDITADVPIIVSVERGDQTLDLTVVPEVREPLTWQTITRFPSAPGSISKVVKVEGFVIPSIDTEALTEQIEQMRIEIDERQILMDSGEFEVIRDNIEIEFHELSEMGNFALHDANIWFGLSMTQGLKLAEIDAGLGEYFKTDRGVLVLKAKTDNDLQLESGDVILQVGNTEVNSPAEFMRALRDFDSGDEFEIDIKRKRKDRTLKMLMPENQSSYFAPQNHTTHTIKITTDSN